MNNSVNSQITSLNVVRNNRKTNVNSKKEIIKEIGKICQNNASVKELTNNDKQNILQNIDKLDENYYNFCLFRKTHTESSVKVWVLIFVKFNNGKTPENLLELNRFISDFSNDTKYKIDKNGDGYHNKNSTYFKNIVDFCNKKLKNACHEDSNPYNSSYKEFNISTKYPDVQPMYNQQNNENDNKVIDEDLQKQNPRSDSVSTTYSENSNDGNSSLKKHQIKKIDPRLSLLEEYILSELSELSQEQKETLKLNFNLQCFQTIINNKYYLKNLKLIKGDALFEFLNDLQSTEVKINEQEKNLANSEQEPINLNVNYEEGICKYKNLINDEILKKVGKQKELNELKEHISNKLNQKQNETLKLDYNLQFIQRIINNDVYLTNLKLMEVDDLFYFLNGLQRDQVFLNKFIEEYRSNLGKLKQQIKMVSYEQELLNLIGNYSNNIRFLKSLIKEKILKTLGETHIQK